ncbi:MAG: hypothetical protein IK141_00260 [Clostridia bacterium]|nr:hypothetical protein [Clostridia bacterium]
MTYESSGEILHSAIVTADASSAFTATVKGKWGCLGVFRHDVLDCPYATVDPSVPGVGTAQFYWEM